MSGFQVPFSSSPPSTPDRRSNDGSKQYSFGASNPSTTPAGPPPSSAGSFTPAGPPPSSIFGSSRLGSQYEDQPFKNLTFSKQTIFEAPKQQYHNPDSSPSAAPFARSSMGAQRSGLSNEYKAPTAAADRFFSANAQENGMDDVDEEDEDDEQDDDEQGESGMEEEDDVYDDGHGNEQYGLDQIDRMVDDMEEDEYSDEDQDMPQFNSSVPSSGPTRQSFSRSRQSDVRGSDRLRQSKEDGVLGFRRSLENPKAQDSMFAGLAKEMYTQMGIPRVNEADDFVLETENLVIRLYEEGIGASEDEDALKRALALIPGELLKLWSDYNNRTLAHVSEEYATAIGPGPRASKFAHANFIASLLIRLRHPTPLAVANSGSQPFRGSLMRGSIAPALEGKVKPIPLLLLEWMDDYHDPYPSQLDEIQAHRPSPANHRLFWDTILNSLLRGRVVAVVNALKTAGWKHARAATEDVRDDSDETEYSGLALSNIEKVINDALQVLQYCPAMRGDWDIRNSDWTLFRLRISQALENLRRFAEGRDRNRDTSDSFEAENFGLSAKATGGQSYSGIAKKAQSKVPWSIYQNLLTMYNLMLGDANAIIGNSEDWCEATIGLVVWWDQGKDDRRLSHGRLRASVEGNDFEVYFRKLAESFYCATSESTDFQVNTLDAIEIGLASVFESDIEAVIGILRSWSGPVSSAVAEIASLGGWLPGPEPQNLIAMDSLDQDDMDLLGISGSSELIDNVKDYTLIVYAEGLARRGQMESSPTFGHPKTVREGWELAIEVLGRLDSATRSEDEVGRLLSGVPLDSGATVDKLWRLLNELGMTKHAENVAEEYADSLAEQSHMYGEALWYYALAHRSKKVKDVLDLLISLSLIHSLAYPLEAELDDHLRRLISSPKATLNEMSKMDFEAARLLHKMLSGYATLRRFYDLRDEEVKFVDGEKPQTMSLARKLEATTALVTVITSADDNIRGGLYDESRGAVVNVDFLLALLGEAMVLVNQPNHTITTHQIHILLKAIEDLQTVTPRVYGACNEFFQTVVASTQGLKGSSPMDMLKKSTSSLSGTSSFSLIGSFSVASQLQKSIGSSGVMVKGNIKRGWDWRKGLSAGTTGEEVLQILRFALAKELAKAWILEADGQ